METVTTSLQQVEVAVTDLGFGMYVSELDIPWLESPFLFQGFVIETREEMEQLRQVCKTVTVDMQRSSDRPVTDWDHVADEDYEVPVERELGAATGVRTNTHQLVNGIFRQIERGQAIDGDAIHATIKDTVDSVMRNPDAMVLLTQIKNKDHYTAEHCINVSVLTAAFERFLGKSRRQIEEAAYCALLHDIGKIRVPDAVLNKKGRFNTEELALMQSHTEHGRDVLLSSHSVLKQAVDVALAHHERMDGSGYPHALPSDVIPYNARLVAVTDAYDAITSTRCYKGPCSSFDALQIMYKDRDRQFDASLVERYIEFMGVYPPGSVVEMSNGEVGIVLSVHPKHKLDPRVLLVRNRYKEPSKERIVDLRHKAVDSTGHPYRIDSTHANGSFGIDVRYYLKQGLLSKGFTGARPTLVS
jgi:HD-GYP domain-containing protein (c-di-GMP phosphodiesterase class II)